MIVIVIVVVIVIVIEVVVATPAVILNEVKNLVHPVFAYFAAPAWRTRESMHCPEGTKVSSRG